jgi:hypothetical protein
MSRPAILAAITSLPHEITGDRVVIFFDPSKPGHNALNQLASAVECATQSDALRDSIATAYLQGRATQIGPDTRLSLVAADAYRAADAMLIARTA